LLKAKVSRAKENSFMQTSFVYILKCSDNTYYTGVTENVFRRFEEHQSGKHFGSYTYFRRPVKLVYCCSFTDIELAIEFEKKLKKWSKAKKDALIAGRYDDLPNLAKKKFKK
jgi:putative endonuclease